MCVQKSADICVNWSGPPDIWNISVATPETIQKCRYMLVLWVVIIQYILMVTHIYWNKCCVALVCNTNWNSNLKHNRVMLVQTQNIQPKCIQLAIILYFNGHTYILKQLWCCCCVSYQWKKPYKMQQNHSTVITEFLSTKRRIFYPHTSI